MLPRRPPDPFDMMVGKPQPLRKENTQSMRVIVVGNGILALTTAYRLIKRNPSASIVLVGPQDRRGCASLAAAAMLNSFGEIESRTLRNPVEQRKFLFNKQAAGYWPDFLRQLEAESGARLHHGFGTFLINRKGMDTFEDENFDAVVSALDEFREPYESVRPDEIPGYEPASAARATRAIHLPREGWVNPVHLMHALETVLVESGCVEFVDDRCRGLERDSDGISRVLTERDVDVSGEVYFLAPGATFSKLIAQSDLGLEMPRVDYGIGCSLLLRCDERTLSHCIRTPHRRGATGVYAVPHDAAHILVGATSVVSTEPQDYPQFASVQTLLQAASEQIDRRLGRSRLVKINVGWRPTPQDSLPLLGPTSISNLFVATGTNRDGLHCSPLISECLADLISSGSCTADISLFRPERALVPHRS